MNWIKSLKANYKQFVLVCTSFVLMIAIANISTNGIIRKGTLATVTVALDETEKTIRAYLREPQIAFDNIYTAIQDMLDRKESQETIRQYLVQSTQLLKMQEEGIKGFLSVSGYIREEYLQGSDILSEEVFIPQQQPWYQLAIRSEGSGYTAPYTDPQTGYLIISLTQQIFSKDGDYYGILTLDIDISWLMEYANSLQFAEGGYGMITNQYLYLIAHPEERYRNMRLQDVGADYARIAVMLHTDQDVTAMRIRDYDKTRSIVFFKELYNEWYVGVVMPVRSYYSDLYLNFYLLAAMGTVLALILSYVLLRLIMKQSRSEEENRSKSTFLARMSHEIRTPVNAIMGMSELALREELPPAAYEQIITVRQASENLLSIINDILDFSKIESGKLEIVSGEYLFSSLINDVISIIRMRVLDSRIRFVVNIDSGIPNVLYGDEIRFRQVLLNILNNAVKYTDEGYVSLTVLGDADEESDTAVLTIEVADSGKGIKPEDLEKLFQDFVQVDSQNNKGIEGTGLGLAITHSIIGAMGGEVSVESEYGVGSTFIVTLPQGILSHEPIAAVADPEEKSVLIYENREIYANSVVCSVDNLNVTCSLAANETDFYQKLKERDWPFVFVASPLYDNVRTACIKSGAHIVLLTGFGDSVSDKNLSILAMPVYSISIANILNGDLNSIGYHEDGTFIARFVAPEARVLVVDDIDTNLKVADGLMLPYQMQVHLCRSGAEAIEAIQKTQYDLILMDHMMPDMDGITATRLIRELDGSRYLNLPIVALTANAVSGAKEMFLANGFHDFLSKPIDTVKLNTQLEKWIPREKQKKSVRRDSSGAAADPDLSFTLEGVDVKKGIALTGGTLANYMQTLTVFHKDGHKKIEQIRECLETHDLSMYTIHVHALKSAAAIIGAQRISEAAFALETAGNKKDNSYIQAHNDSFIANLEVLLDRIAKVLPRERVEENVDNEVLQAELLRLKEALDSYDPDEIDEASDQLKVFAQSATAGEAIRDILQNTLIGEYGNAIILIDDFLKTI